MTFRALVRYQDPARATDVVRAGASAARLMVIGPETFTDLVRELGGSEVAVLEWLWQLAIQVDKPIGLQPQPDEETVFCAPPGWSEARLRRYLGAMASPKEA
jgi:hypothetical protein